MTDEMEGTLEWQQPLILSLLAGLSTCLGAACAFCLGGKNRGKEQMLSHAHMAFALALAGSVMVTVSFASILPESFRDDAIEGPDYSMIPMDSLLFAQRCGGFGIGCLLYVLLSKCAFPEPDAILELDREEDTVDEAQEDVEKSSSDSPKSSSSNSQALPLIKRQRSSPPPSRPLVDEDEVDDDDDKDSGLNDNDKTARRNWLVSYSTGADLKTNSARRAWRVTMLLFISLAVHNFPEGLAVAASTMHSIHLGLTTTIAIALHNIPEGIAIAVPCLAARPNSPCLAFGLASLSGLAEPLGALVALFILGDSANNDPNDLSWISMKNTLAFVAGIMTTVAIIELFPEAVRHSSHTWVPLVMGLLVGVAIMLGSEMYLDSDTD